MMSLDLQQQADDQPRYCHRSQGLARSGATHALLVGTALKSAWSICSIVCFGCFSIFAIVPPRECVTVASIEAVAPGSPRPEPLPASLRLRRYRWFPLYLLSKTAHRWLFWGSSDRRHSSE